MRGREGDAGDLERAFRTGTCPKLVSVMFASAMQLSFIAAAVRESRLMRKRKMNDTLKTSIVTSRLQIKQGGSTNLEQ